MKNTFYCFITTLFFSLSLSAQQTNIVVAIAKKSTNCISTDLAFKVYYGDSDPYELKKSASNAVKQMVSDWDNVETVDNYDWSKPLGTYMVIISSTTTDSNGCKRNVYGVGFGDNVNDALTRSKRHLSGRNWSWNENKHGYNVVAQKQY
jgi:hypothetical protein